MKDLLRAIESLPIHTISGYEWECAECEYNWDSSQYEDRQGNGCDHGRLIDLDLLLVRLKEPAA